MKIRVYAIHETEDVHEISDEDFMDKADRSYGEYLGLVDSNIKACKAVGTSPSRVMNNGVESTIADSQ